MASTAQFVVSALVVVALVVIAIALGRVRVEAPADAQAPPSVQVVGAAAFVLGSVFMGLVNMPTSVPAALTVAAMLAVLILGSLLIWNWSRRPAWSQRHRLATAGGLLLVYAWYGFVQVPSVPGTNPMIDAIGNAVFASGALILLFFAWRRVSETSVSE